MAVQRLFDACKATFILPSPPSAQTVQRVRTILDSIKSSDVGLDEGTLEQYEREFGVNGWRSRRSTSGRSTSIISYLHLYESDAFSMGIFCLPTSAVIPLHNHPGMTVLSKFLYGSMHVKAYDWLNPLEERSKADASKPRVAKLVVDTVMTVPCETAILYPSCGGNVHAFTALSPCAVLDILVPPYSALLGRPCTYYQECIGGGVNEDESGQALCWLEEFQPPDDFVVERGLYMGPTIVP